MLRSAARRDAERLAQRMVEDDAVELAPTVIVLVRGAFEGRREGRAGEQVERRIQALQQGQVAGLGRVPGRRGR